MQLKVNGDLHNLPAGSSVSDLLQVLNLSGPVAVERNSQVVPRAQHLTECLKENDVIEIVHFVGGG